MGMPERATSVEREIYLDYNSTTPCAKEVVDVMLPYLSQQYGNPSSPHLMGKRAYAACSDAREQVSELLGCSSAEIVFTSSATESNNLVLKGVMAKAQRRKIVTTAVEHKSVLEPCRVIRDQGIEVVVVPANEEGVVDLERAKDAIDEGTALVSVQGANNETGVIQPIEHLMKIAHSKGALFHCDAAQLLGKVPLPRSFVEVDYATFSAHKIYGPKGLGILYIRKGIAHRFLQPILHGGSQEGGLRAGTLNVPGVIGAAEACRIVRERVVRDVREITALRDRFERLIIEALPHAG